VYGDTLFWAAQPEPVGQHMGNCHSRPCGAACVTVHLGLGGHRWNGPASSWQLAREYGFTPSTSTAPSPTGPATTATPSSAAILLLPAPADTHRQQS
jgi:hypothetical protein